MALSNMTIVSDGNLEFVSISFNYLDRSEINVYFDSVPTNTWAWVGDTNQIKFTPKVPNGVTVLIARATDASDLRHIFSEGAAFTAKTLDEDLRQVLHIVQEARETNLSGNFYSDIDMHDNKVTNLAPGSNPSDAVTFQQLQDLSPDAGLRAELAKDYLNTGSGLVGFRQDGTGAIGRSVESKLRETVSVGDFGAVGDGITDDTDAFTHLELSITGRDIDLHGKTYKVSTIPIGNRYYGGTWVLPTGNSRARWEGAQLTGAGRVAFGDGALEALPIDYSVESTGAVIAIGYKAMSKMTQAKKSIAIGPNAQENSLISRDNVAIGDSALKNVQSVTPDYSQTYQDGTRNVGVGGNAGYFVTSGRNITAIGRNAGQCLTGDIGGTAYGGNAYAGYGPIGLSGEIENWAPTTTAGGGVNYSVAIGNNALNKGTTNYCVAVGGNALQNNKKSNGNVALGAEALRDLDINTWYNGGAHTTLGIDGTYTQSGTTLTLDIVGHTLSPGDIALFRLLDGGSQTFSDDIVPAYVDSTPTADQFVIISPKSITANGTARLYSKATAAQQPKNEANTAVGCLSMPAVENATENSVVGYRSLNDATTATKNVAVGFRTLTGLSHAENCTAVGHDSLRFMQDGSVSSGTGTNRTGLGFNTRVSGNNQVQLGNSGTTTYVYGTVQNRSDIRDKTDIRNTQLGLNFINKLRPVDFKWDMRDDYFESDDQGNLIPLPKDGSKARRRYHHGLIAQEVQSVIEETGLDFGGFQDHKVNGGCDVMSIGYDELIGPLIKAVQELHKIIGDLQTDVTNLQNRVQNMENSL